MLYVKDKHSKSKKNLFNLTPKYYCNHMWRLIYLINSNNVYNTLLKKFYNGSSTIPNTFIGYEIFIYSGLKWLSRVINKWSTGLKLGTLSWNRKRALFKSKLLKKK